MHIETTVQIDVFSGIYREGFDLLESVGRRWVKTAWKVR